MTTTKEPFASLKYCKRCCFPETVEGLAFDDMGYCRVCQSSEQKMHINWIERRKQLKNILEDAKRKAGNNYDCIVPISGGKDSAFQLHVLTKVFDMRPLAVTFSHNWYSKTGFYNLMLCLETFEVDHIMFTPNRKLVNRLAKRSLDKIGDTCWHCHSGVGSFPLQIAVKYNIPLLVWGESTAELSGRASYFEPKQKFDREYFLKVSAKVPPEEMVCGEISQKELSVFQVPSVEECEKVGVYGIHLGDFVFWDEERQVELLRHQYGWRETEMEGTYKRYKSAECVMPGVHDATCYLKRGFGRATCDASKDVRAGLLTREEGFKLIDECDSVRPDALDYFLNISGLTEEEYLKIMAKHRRSELQGVDLPVKLKPDDKRKKVQPFVLDVIDELQEK